RTFALRRFVVRLAAHSVNDDAPTDIMTRAVIIPSWNRNARIRIVYQLIAPSTQTRRRTASPTVTTMVTGLKSASSKPAISMHAPSDINTFFVTITNMIATNGGSNVSIG